VKRICGDVAKLTIFHLILRGSSRLELPIEMLETVFKYMPQG